MPASSFGGQFLHGSLAEMAAAYLFQITKNHPFVDGNKRAALASALQFLWLNDLEIDATDDEMTDLVFGIAKGLVGKLEVVEFLKLRSQPRN